MKVMRSLYFEVIGQCSESEIQRHPVSLAR